MKPTMTLGQRVFENAESFPEKAAISFKTETVTYGQLKENILVSATNLLNLGVKPGDRVMINSVSKPETISAYLALRFIGASVIFLDKNATEETTKSIIEDSEPVLLLTDKPIKFDISPVMLSSLKGLSAGEAAQGLTHYIPEDESLSDMIYTSGTTGKPKGVMLSAKAVFNILHNTVKGIGIQSDDIILLPLPLHHSYALRVLRAYLWQGGHIVLQNGFAFGRETQQNIENFGCTAMSAVPASMELMRNQLKEKFIPLMQKLRYIECGSGSLTMEQRNRLVNALPDTAIYNTWGSSESGGALFLDVTDIVKNHPEKILSIGAPIEGVSVKVVDSEGNAIVSSPENTGRLAVKGDNIMSGYRNREELNRQTLVDGFLCTNDIVYTDSDGFVYMLGRADDIINTGGEKVSPVEVENVSGQFPGIKECACIGAPDESGILGQIPSLIVVPSEEGFDEAEFKRFISGKLENVKIPARYILTDALPRSPIGKLKRDELKKLL